MDYFDTRGLIQQMPPRKVKAQKDQIVAETPVVFFLKVLEEDINPVIPAEETVSYSDILETVETTKIADRFNTDLLKSILEKVTTTHYSRQTACFWCCHTFSWASVVLPVSYDAYKNLYTCEGHFCSPECALAENYSNNRISDATRWNRHALLQDLYSELYKNRTLSLAPPRCILRMFGGPLDIQQYREYITSSNDIVISDIAPIRLHFPSMNVQGPLRDVKKYVSLSNETVEKASEQLRLKRSKPMNNNIQTLDMCIKQKV
jgi:hypothetical protein